MARPMPSSVRGVPEQGERPPIIAYQLSLLGEEPKPCAAWRRPYFQWSFCGIPVPLSEEEERQCRMLRPDSLGTDHA